MPSASSARRSNGVEDPGRWMSTQNSLMARLDTHHLSRHLAGGEFGINEIRDVGKERRKGGEGRRR